MSCDERESRKLNPRLQCCCEGFLVTEAQLNEGLVGTPWESRTEDVVEKVIEVFKQ